MYFYLFDFILEFGILVSTYFFIFGSLQRSQLLIQGSQGWHCFKGLQSLSMSSSNYESETGIDSLWLKYQFCYNYSFFLNEIWYKTKQNVDVFGFSVWAYEIYTIWNLFKVKTFPLISQLIWFCSLSIFSSIIVWWEDDLDISPIGLWYFDSGGYTGCRGNKNQFFLEFMRFLHYIDWLYFLTIFRRFKHPQSWLLSRHNYKNWIITQSETEFW